MSLQEENQMEQVLYYLSRLARALIANGATIEHVELALEKNAQAYGLKELSSQLDHQHVSVCFTGSDHRTYMKQLNVPVIAINLERIKCLNELSYRVANDPVDPRDLRELLREANQMHPYQRMTVVFCQMLAICSICYILGGDVKDMLSTALVTFVLYWIRAALANLRTAAVINNIISMFLVTVLTFFVVRLGLADNTQWTLISVSLLMIPGIPLVNAFRNLICGNEITGIMQLLNVFLESASLAAGTFLGVILMGGSGAW